ncbi:hypothetical protein CASFOL_042832 [Castilleja foliolosa]|uniref:Hexokinase N-terminal domain-containing protein n=1 Tax=Castilleja foliolosa TaxID=1961234 RepID=A0ABD3B7H2_9LAMI
MCSGKPSLEDATFGSKQLASVYLASTPQQTAELGLKFPGVDEVEEIDDVDGTSSDPFVADAIANEGDLSLTEEQKKNFRKEEDANADRKRQIRLKRRRLRKQSKEKGLKRGATSDICFAVYWIGQWFSDAFLYRVLWSLAFTGANNGEIITVANTYVQEGVFYALDLGGTNFCVLRVQLGGKERGAL